MGSRLAPLALTAALALTGCTTDATTDHDSHVDVAPVADGARSIEISASSFVFDPDALRIAAGEDIAIALTSTDVSHDLVIDEVDFHVAADRGERQQGGMSIDVPGSYTAYCSVAGHREAGIEMTVTVTE